MGGIGVGGLCIAPAGVDELAGGDPAATVPPDADTGEGCQEIGVASCGAGSPGDAVPGLLLAAATGGMLPTGGGDAEGEKVAKVGVNEDGVMPVPA